MTNIRLLPEDVSRKIAAGEVIERPVSVVKELVENSLDAGATEIFVELREGGKRFILVRDNGSGMSREDAALCFRRHATSKISSEDDLERIATLGFRGEALASISAVSRLSLRTFNGTDERGIHVKREGDKLLTATDIAFPKGTTIEVSDLFFNLPARQKFLRSNPSELGVIVKYITQTALAYHDVRFVLVHGTRELVNCPPVRMLKERIFQLYGKSLVEGLMEVVAEEGGARLEGFSSRPLSGRADRAHQFFFVNKRAVKDRILQSALNQAYRGLLEKGQSAEAFLFLALPYADVDVNVHPAKAEVRFRDSQNVFRLVLRAVEHAVGKGLTIKEVPGVTAEERGETEEGPGSSPLPKFEIHALPVEAAAEVTELREERGRFEATGAGKTETEVLGQYENMYIVTSSPEALLIIDQHNAHERVLFEKYKEIDREKIWPRKMLLVPELLDLSPSQVVSLEENAALFEELGFRVEAMGGRSYALKEYPDIFKPEETKDILLALLEDGEREKVRDRREKFLATLACKTAVKSGEPLNGEKMGYLVHELFKTAQPALCPHGRPIVVKIDKFRIDKGMGR